VKITPRLLSVEDAAQLRRSIALDRRKMAQLAGRPLRLGVHGTLMLAAHLTTLGFAMSDLDHLDRHATVDYYFAKLQ
jgi:hypothetical protein